MKYFKVMNGYTGKDVLSEKEHNIQIVDEDGKQLISVGYNNNGELYVRTYHEMVIKPQASNTILISEVDMK